MIAGTIPGIISPTLTGIILGDTPSIREWRVVFYICFAVYTFGIIVWVIFASGERIKFPNHPDESLETATKVTSDPADKGNNKSVEMDEKERTPENTTTV